MWHNHNRIFQDLNKEFEAFDRSFFGGSGSRGGNCWKKDFFSLRE
jgi:hypothetical protein